MAGSSCDILRSMRTGGVWGAPTVVSTTGSTEGDPDTDGREGAMAATMRPGVDAVTPYLAGRARPVAYKHPEAQRTDVR